MSAIHNPPPAETRLNGRDPDTGQRFIVSIYDDGQAEIICTGQRAGDSFGPPITLRPVRGAA